MTDTTLFLSLQALEIFKENFTFSNSRLSAQAQPPPTGRHTTTYAPFPCSSIGAIETSSGGSDDDEGGGESKEIIASHKGIKPGLK